MPILITSLSGRLLDGEVVPQLSCVSGSGLFPNVHDLPQVILVYVENSSPSALYDSPDADFLGSGFFFLYTSFSSGLDGPFTVESVLEARQKYHYSFR